MNNPKKFLVFDAGPIISLTMNGLLGILEKLKQHFGGGFVITPNVKFEVIERPLKIKKYKFEALQVQNVLDKRVLRLSSEFIKNSQIEKEAKLILNSANSLFRADKENIRLIQKGEASCLAFSKLCKKENAIVIDERTTRMITESPRNLQQLMQNKLHTSIHVNQRNLEVFKGFKFIRSTELLYIAYKKNLFEIAKDRDLLESVLYAVKYKGAAISSHEIEEMKTLSKSKSFN